MPRPTEEPGIVGPRACTESLGVVDEEKDGSVTRIGDEVTKRGTVTPLLITLTIVAAVAIGGLLLRLHQQQNRVPMLTHAVELDARTLLVRDADEAWRVLDLEGALGDVVPLGARAQIVAQAGDVLWLQSDDEPLSAVQASQLAPIASAAAAARALGAPLIPRGATTDGDLVVRGPAGREHRVGVDGTVQPAASVQLLPVQAFDPSRGGRGQRLGVRRIPPLPAGDDAGFRDDARAAQPFRLTDLQLLEPHVVMRWASGQPLALRRPDGYLVVSADAVGDQGDQRLSRVSTDGRVRWSVSAAELMGPSSRRHAAHRVLWVGGRGGELVALVQAWWTEVQSDTKIARRDEWGEPRLVRLAATTGAVVQRIEIRRSDVQFPR